VTRQENVRRLIHQRRNRSSSGTGKHQANYRIAEGQAMTEQTSFDYERTDIASVGIAWTAGGLAAFVILTPLLMPFVFPQSMKHKSPAAPPALNANAPRLEITPREDLKRFRRSEMQLTSTYGWSDREHGQVRIPIAQAMQMLVHKGLPGWPSQ
jgi:hypothetical protein